MDKLKDFNDLVFQPHPVAIEAKRLPETAWQRDEYLACKHAVLNFENGYGISVVLGSIFYSNGIDTYEVAMLFHGEYYGHSRIIPDVKGYVNAEKVSAIMKEIQQLPKV